MHGNQTTLRVGIPHVMTTAYYGPLGKLLRESRFTVIRRRTAPRPPVGDWVAHEGGIRFFQFFPNGGFKCTYSLQRDCNSPGTTPGPQQDRLQYLFQDLTRIARQISHTSHGTVFLPGPPPVRSDRRRSCPNSSVQIHGMVPVKELPRMNCCATSYVFSFASSSSSEVRPVLFIPITIRAPVTAPHVFPV